MHVKDCLLICSESRSLVVKSNETAYSKADKRAGGDNKGYFNDMRGKCTQKNI